MQLSICRIAASNPSPPGSTPASSSGTIAPL
eukprot:CAMPEP_0172202892 /NCGR_PEP_ID=MMETSP1050-20130122/30944_1 /TAXON_ID=233186 /ORGANISM="Cryptomonas curvata, Strain CCAP979/52" /LENGTH=30 /DNA_ID= /DNA_START= /DNA_END= /DNA_ORIENTATION=